MHHPAILHLEGRNYEFKDFEFNVSDINLYFICPAGELKAYDVEFNSYTEDDELILIIFFKDHSYKGFSLCNYSMNFLYD